MDDYAEQVHFEDDQFAYNGEEFHEDFETLDHHHQQQREQFDSRRGFEQDDNVDSSGNEIKHSSIGHRDSASQGLVRVFLITEFEKFQLLIFVQT
jgi:hypothetical protein